MLGISNQDLVFKLKSIGVRVEGNNANIDTDIVAAILQGKKLPYSREAVLSDEPAQPASKAAAAPKKATAAKTGSKAAAVPKTAARKKAATGKTGSKAAAALKKAATAKSAKTGGFYQIFDSPLEPRHFSVDRLRQVVKKS